MTDDKTSAGLIPERLQPILSNDVRAFANLALVRKDGTPHVSPVWFEWDGEHIIINTARERVKDNLLKRRPVVSMSIQDPADPYRYLLITGPVVDETEEGGYEHICDLQQKYHGNRDYPKIPGQVRVIYKVRPEHVFASKK
jgi:PPOX class probable F420-dependent enzyme